MNDVRCCQRPQHRHGERSERVETPTDSVAAGFETAMACRCCASIGDHWTRRPCAGVPLIQTKIQDVVEMFQVCRVLDRMLTVSECHGVCSIQSLEARWAACRPCNVEDGVNFVLV